MATTSMIPEANVTRNIQDEWALPTVMDQVFAIEDKEYRFCVHCHTPKPVAQITPQGTNAGICVNCVNGRNNYLRLAKRGLLTWPSAVPAPVAPTPKAAAPAPAPKRVAKGGVVGLVNALVDEAMAAAPEVTVADTIEGLTPGERGIAAAKADVLAGAAETPKQRKQREHAQRLADAAQGKVS